MQTMEKNTLADKISSILTTAPVHFDSEDENDDTTASVVPRVESESDEDILVNKSDFRKQNIDFLADVDKRYAGKARSRRNLNSDDISSSSDNEYSENNNFTDDKNGESEDGEEEEETEDEDDGDNEEYESNSDQEFVNQPDSLENNKTFKVLKDSNITQQVKKGMCVKNQMSLWENLLEMRIQVQKCLVASNKMPQHDKFQEIKTESGPDFSKTVQQTKKSIFDLLEKLLLLQNLLWKQYPEMKKFKKFPTESSADDEEIPSDTDEENDEEEDGSEPIPKKRLKDSDFEKEICDKHNLYKEYRNSVIQKWHDKTRMPIMKNSNTHSIINHIEHTLADKAKLIKRTQIKRSDYTIIGEEAVDSNTEITKDSVSEHNSEIFDDGDFYHQLLRELIEVKSADLTDPIQLGRQWLQLQTLRSKMKRKVDTKATKGRKIRYAVHTKLVNFMAPRDNSLWSDEAKTDLFSSLFGKCDSTGS